MSKSRSIRSVAITCDFLRAQFDGQGFSNFQPRNLAWLESVIGAKDTWAEWGITTNVITAPTLPEEFRQSLGNESIFSGYLLDAERTWASIYDTEDVTVFSSLFEELLQHDLVVGFELPPTIKRALHRAGKPYISFCIHPLRFLRDLCFLVHTNSVEIAQQIAELEISADEVSSQVRRFKGLFSRLQLPAFSLPSDTPVLIGQTEKDSVLIQNGRFMSWENYENELDLALKDHLDLIFLEHPYRESSAPITEYLRNRHGKNIVSLRANSYGVLFSPKRPPFFMTLASSLGCEALAAGHECAFLLANPREKFIVPDVDVPSDSMVSHATLHNAFWKRLFEGRSAKRQINATIPADSFFLGDDYIRNSLDSWSFRGLQYGLNPEPVRKLIVPSSQITTEQLALLNNQLCGSSAKEPSDLPASSRHELDWGWVDTLQKPIAIGECATVDLTQPAATYYLEGFHAPESWGVWSSGLHSRILCPIELSGEQETKIEVSMLIKVFDGIRPFAPILQISVEGKEIGIALFRPSLKQEKAIKFTAKVRHSPCHLEFHLTHVQSPRRAGLSPDQRELGFGLSQLVIAVSTGDDDANAHADGHATSRFWGLISDENSEGLVVSALTGDAA